MKIAIGSDHAGFSLKEYVKKFLGEMNIEIDDAGAGSEEPVDYPDYGIEVARKVSSGISERGILICGSGIGMSIVANKLPGIRAALCLDADTARMSRRHNNSNVLVLAGRKTDAREAEPILRTWLDTPFDGGRHQLRLDKIRAIELNSERIPRSLLRGASNDFRGEEIMSILWREDPEVASAILQETKRQAGKLDLIASENFVSEAVLEAQGCIMTNKYAEGYPGKRYYGGCEFVDIAETLAIERAKKLFGADHVNVQPHSGNQANMAVYFAALQPGDTVLGMNLAHGGHLTHGSPVNFSGRLYNVVSYGVDKETETIDFNEVEDQAKKHKPKMIVVGASAYPRIIDFTAFREIADKVGAVIMADIAHVAGLVATGLHPSPVPMCEFVTTTTHKTLRGPRGGMIMCKEEFAKVLNSRVFPGSQGGPLMHIIAAKAVALKEALDPEFKDYQAQIVKNAKAMADALTAAGLRLVSGGTDNHLMLVDVAIKGITGKDAEETLDRAGLTVNKNSIPFDTKGPQITSGIRLGTPAITSRGMKEEEMWVIGRLIAHMIGDITDEKRIREVKNEVASLCEKFPLYSNRIIGDSH